MLIVGGSATVSALTGMHTIAAIYLLPVGVVAYTLVGGLKATILTDWVVSNTIALSWSTTNRVSLSRLQFRCLWSVANMLWLSSQTNLLFLSSDANIFYLHPTYTLRYFQTQTSSRSCTDRAKCRSIHSYSSS
jgi:hypothetical protein